MQAWYIAGIGTDLSSDSKYRLPVLGLAPASSSSVATRRTWAARRAPVRCIGVAHAYARGVQACVPRVACTLVGSAAMRRATSSAAPAAAAAKML